eukprot:5349578-Ditylum_brightwellii.AAC.1
MEDGTMTKRQVKKMKRDKSQAAKREASLARSHSRPRTPSQMGLKDDAAVRIASRREKEGRNKWLGRSGEGDQRQAVHLVKWCNTGKKRNGTHYQR